MNEQVQQHQPTANADPAITLTERALTHVRRYMAKQGHGTGLRLSITTTGCSGLAYKTQLVDAPEAGDIVSQVAADVTLYIDPKAVTYIRGMQIDYVKEGLQERFVYQNPNQKGECGCGESFTV